MNDERCKKKQVLSTVAATEPHATLSGFIFGLKHRYIYFMKTIQVFHKIQNYWKKASAITLSTFLLNSYECSDMQREVFDLPAKYGRLRMINPSKISDCEYHKSRLLKQEGSQLIKNQHLIYNVNENNLREIKNGINIL